MGLLTIRFAFQQLILPLIVCYFILAMNEKIQNKNVRIYGIIIVGIIGVLSIVSFIGNCTQKNPSMMTPPNYMGPANQWRQMNNLPQMPMQMRNALPPSIPEKTPQKTK